MYVDETRRHHMSRRVDRPYRLNMIMLTPVYRDRISLYKHCGVEPGASSAINHLAVNDLDINQ